MIPVPTAQQMREIDRYTIEEMGIPARVLMESAGEETARQILKRLRRGDSTAVLCGRGNNGGDGFAAARRLKHAGADAQIYLAAAPVRPDGPAYECLQAAQKAGVPVHTPPHDCLQLNRHAWIIDALMGVGAKSAPRGEYARLIDAVNAAANSSSARVLACDMPSGIRAWADGDGDCVRADITLAIGFPKPPLVLYPGVERVGRLIAADIGFPKQAVERARPHLFWVEKEDAAAPLPVRPPDAHKGRFGRAVVVGGSKGMTGAASLAALGALRVGAGLSAAAVPASSGDAVDASAAEATTLYLPETEDGTLSLRAAEPLQEELLRADAAAVGPGLSQHPETRRLLLNLYAEWAEGRRPPAALAVDADGLNAAAPLSETRARFPKNAVLTPHTGEMARLIGLTPAETEKRRIEAPRSLAMELGAVVLLKGAPTAVASPDGRVFLNPTGNSGMATGGSGDVLTGALAGLLAQGMPPLDAAVSAAYLHGLAGDIAYQQNGAGLTARDILRALPAALQQTLRKEPHANQYRCHRRKRILPNGRSHRSKRG